MEMGRRKAKDGDVVSVEENKEKVASNVYGRGVVSEGLEVLLGGEEIWVFGNIV